MTKRAATVEATRQKIVQATLQLHAEQGIAATSWDQIAECAGVGVGTVYRHFRNLDELLPACGKLTMSKLDIPQTDIFDEVEPGLPRLRLLVESVFAVYQRGQAEIRNVQSEAELHPAINEARREVESALDALVAAAVDERHGLVRALIDLGTWQSLLTHGDSDPVDCVVELLSCQELVQAHFT